MESTAWGGWSITPFLSRHPSSSLHPLNSLSPLPSRLQTFLPYFPRIKEYNVDFPWDYEYYFSDALPPHSSLTATPLKEDPVGLPHSLFFPFQDPFSTSLCFGLL